MLKNKILFCVICFLINILVFINASIGIEAIQVPENDINIKIENLTRGTEVYLLLPETLLRYNMERYISNNLNNSYELENEKAQDLQEFLNNNDFLGYVNYYKEEGFNQKAINEVELRHYGFSLSESEIIEQVSYNDLIYVKIKINLDEENNFKLILKDYLSEYNSLDIKFMINDYGTETYIDMPQEGYIANPENSYIRECNITYLYMSEEEYNSIERAIDLTYLILFIILLIIILVIVILLIKRHIKKKQEIEARKFWKKKLTKEEKKEAKKKLKEEKKKNKKEKKK